LFSSQGFDLRNEFSVLVVRTESGKDIGLIVDEIRDFEDVVIKDLVPILKKIPVYSGATFLSDGTVGLLLSVDGVAAVAQVHVGVGIKKKLEREDTAIQCSDTSTEWLLFELGVPGVYAFPRDMVFRLEEFEGQAIQKSGGFDVIPYRGQILPIIQLGKFLGWDGGVKDGLEGRVQVVVMTHGQKFVAFKIKQILDIASTMNPIDEPISEQLGVRGNLIMGGKTVTVLDPERLLAV
jgi:two-component system chemotaxis sensor kinase CheA